MVAVKPAEDSRQIVFFTDILLTELSSAK